jgi:hypothetical protein
VLLTELHHAMKSYWGSGGIARRILDLDTRWRRVVAGWLVDGWMDGSQIIILALKFILCFLLILSIRNVL